MSLPTETEYASPERSSLDEILKEFEVLKASELLKKYILKMTQLALILNQNRQIIYTNESLLNSLGITEDDALGLRPGELLSCIHSETGPNGCGTSKACRYCGFVNTILKSHVKEGIIEDECRLMVSKGKYIDNLDLIIRASTFRLDDKIFTLVHMQDISDKKRKEALDRIFYHDVLNKAGGLKGIVELMMLKFKSDNTEFNEILDMLHKNMLDLVEEILSQRDLMLAENNTLKINLTYVDSFEFLTNFVLLFSKHEAAEGKILTFSDKTEKFSFITDKVLLNRIIGNLIKNALEASEINMTVTIGAALNGDNIEFSVHNETYMNEEIQANLFHRSFSTKGKNRGLGAYSVKLLTERYLGGKVEFESDIENGTTFRVLLPNRNI